MLGTSISHAPYIYKVQAALSWKGSETFGKHEDRVWAIKIDMADFKPARPILLQVYDKKASEDHN